MCSRESRRQWLKVIAERNRTLQKKATAWEIVALLDENRVKLMEDGTFQPDFKSKPVYGSFLPSLVDHLMKGDDSSYRIYPRGYLEFLIQVRGYKQQKYFTLPPVPSGARSKYDYLEKKFYRHQLHKKV